MQRPYQIRRHSRSKSAALSAIRQRDRGLLLRANSDSETFQSSRASRRVTLIDQATILTLAGWKRPSQATCHPENSGSIIRSFGTPIDA
jgi:hypothetical protein